MKNDVVKKEVNNIDISGFVLKTKNDAHKSDFENKISDAGKNNSWY